MPSDELNRAPLGSLAAGVIWTIPPVSSLEAVSENVIDFPGSTVNRARSAGVGELQITFDVSLRAAGTRKRSAEAATPSATENEERTARPTNTLPLRVAPKCALGKGWR